MRVPPPFPPVSDNVKPSELGTRLEHQFRAIDGALQNIEMPDILTSGSPVPGNVSGEVVRVRFRLTDTDTPAVHHQGRVLPRWILVGKILLDANGARVDPTAFVDIRDGHHAPGSNVTYLRSTFSAPVVQIDALVFLFGAPR